MVFDTLPGWIYTRSATVAPLQKRILAQNSRLLVFNYQGARFDSPNRRFLARPELKQIENHFCSHNHPDCFTVYLWC